VNAPARNILQMGLGDVKRDLKALGIADRQAERKVIAAGGKVLKAAIQSQLRRSGTRRRRGEQPASAPGQPPAMQTRELFRSIGTQWRGQKLRVGTDLIRGRFLEFGTAEIRARPFMRPAYGSVKDAMGAVAAQELRQGRGGGV
jgi:HK97 gp10 family phage protein